MPRFPRVLLFIAFLVFGTLLALPAPAVRAAPQNSQPVADAVWGQPDFSANGTGLSATALTFPTSVTVDGAGDLYVADLGNNRILYFPAGSTTATRVYGQPDFTSNSGGTSATTFNRPCDSALDSAGNLYVADSLNNRVLYFPAGSTTATRVYGQPDLSSHGTGSSATTLANPNYIALDNAGGLYVADSGNNRVLYFPAGDTKAIRVYGQPDLSSHGAGTSATAFTSPMGVRLDSVGGLYVSDSGNNRVVYFPAGSTTATRVYGQPDLSSNGSGTSATALDLPNHIALDSADGLYVADSRNNRVLYFLTGSTTATRVYGQPDFSSRAVGTSATALGLPFGITLDSVGNLYVVDTCSNRVLRFPKTAAPPPTTPVTVQMQLRSDVAASSATQITTVLTITNGTNAPIPAGTKLMFRSKGLTFNLKTSTLTGGATFGKAKGTATLDAALAPGGSLTLTLRLVLTKAAKTFTLKATLLTYSSNSISSTGDGATQMLMVTAPKKTTAKAVTTIKGAFFADNEPIIVTISPTPSGVPATITANASGVATLTLKGLASSTYTATFVGQWSGVVGTATFTVG